MRQTATGGTNNPTFTNSYEYDGFNRLTRALSTNQSIFPEEVYSFNNTSGQLDGLSRMFSRTIGGTPHTYTYDADKPDAPRTYGANGAVIGYGYDVNGNQTTHVITSTNSTQTRNFDAENRIESIQEGSTTTTMVYDANGMRLIKSVTQNNVTSNTLYIGNMYEEEVSSPNQNKPYTNYYSFAGKLVGMRKGNQSNPADDRQLRVVGDHLGSTTLVIDTGNPPQVVHRQYYKPYGEIAQQSGTQQTSIGYTGQRLDQDSGLMYYGARFYDPVLSYFVSADPVAPSKVDPKSRQRYAYVLNNPLRYTDATGLTPEGEFPPLIEFPRLIEGDLFDQPYWREWRELLRFGFFTIGLNWTVEDLQLILDAIHDFMNFVRGAGKWSYQDFKDTIGIGNRIVTLANGRITDIDPRATNAHAVTQDLGNTIAVTLDIDKILGRYGDARGKSGTKYAEALKYIFVHELAHVWDVASGYYHSDLMHQTFYSSKDPGCAAGATGDVQCDPLGDMATLQDPNKPPVSKYGAESRQEDWAESVASTIYPNVRTDEFHGNQNYQNQPSNPRRDFVCERLRISCAP